MCDQTKKNKKKAKKNRQKTQYIATEKSSVFIP